MIIHFYGNRGSGKTLSSVILCDLLNKFYNSKNKRCIIFSDVEMQLREYDIIEYFNKEFQNTKQPKIFLFDEVDKFVDSRSSMTLTNKYISYSIGLSRKTDTDYIFTTQIYNSLDVRLRRFTDLIISPTYNKKTYKLKWDIQNLNLDISKTLNVNLDIKKYYKKYDTNYLTLDLIDNYMLKFQNLTKNFKGNKK